MNENNKTYPQHGGTPYGNIGPNGKDNQGSKNNWYYQRRDHSERILRWEELLRSVRNSIQRVKNGWTAHYGHWPQAVEEGKKEVARWEEYARQIEQKIEDEKAAELREKKEQKKWWKKH